VFTFCPKCESRDLGDQWVGPGRTLQQYCRNCDWEGTKRVPEQKIVHTKKEIKVNQFYGFEYHLFDRFGHIMVYSKTYPNEKAAELDLEREIERGKKDVEAGPYKGVLWPATTVVEGKLYE